LRTGFFFKASVSSSFIRSTAASRFALCVRYRWQMTCITPSLLARVASFLRILFFCSSDSIVLFSTSKNKVTRVFTLLTFCPPGPPLREYLKISSSAGIIISLFFSVTMSFTVRTKRVFVSCSGEITQY